MMVDGMLGPIELAHPPYKHEMIYEDHAGAPALKRSGKDEPAAPLADIVEWLKGVP
jgi:polyphosphate glucokinase